MNKGVKTEIGNSPKNDQLLYYYKILNNQDPGCGPKPKNIIL